jgi:hypothetical protein
LFLSSLLAIAEDLDRDNQDQGQEPIGNQMSAAPSEAEPLLRAKH